MHFDDNRENFLAQTDTRYFSPTEFENFLKTADDKTFSILHLNIRSLNKNCENLKFFLSTFENYFSFKAICLTETWNAEDDPSTRYNIPNYTLINQARANGKAGGGICIYLLNSLKHKIRHDLSINNTDCESLSVEIFDSKQKNIISSTIYRPPSGRMAEFKKIFKNVTLKTRGRIVYFVGDLNLNVLDYSSNKVVQNFINLTFQNGLFPLINKPTRITRKSSTAIDNIITNNYSNNSFPQSGIVKTDITDHFPIFTIAHQLNETLKKPYPFFKRYVNENSLNYFNILLSETDWSLMYETTDANEAYNVFLRYFLSAYDKAFPLKKIELSSKTLTSPWMSKGLLKSSRKKQKLYEKFLRLKTYRNEIAYKNYKSTFEKLKKQAKRNYYNTQLTKYAHSVKHTWRIIKNLMGREGTQRNSLPEELIHNNQKIYVPKEIAEQFNNFFVNVGPHLASKIDKPSTPFTSYIKNIKSSIQCSEMTEVELIQAFKHLKPNKSVGLDDIDVNVVKHCFYLIKQQLFFIFNLSLTSGVFPDKLKLAKVIPIYKSGTKCELSNYRPISILPCFSKLLERIMYNRLCKYFDGNSLLYQKQFGFRSGLSTDQAILYITQNLLQAFDKTEHSLGIFIDLSKAFDTVDHDILLTKLDMYGVKGVTRDWLKSYLTNRMQSVSYSNKEYTSFQIIRCGVPQGSILGPLLFLIYVNDLSNCLEKLNAILFADDTNLFYKHKCIKTLFNEVNSDLLKLREWFQANKLSLNLNKTKYIFFHPSRNEDEIPLKLPRLIIDGTEIKREKFIKFLGVILDESLSWKNHIDMVKIKTSKNLGIMYKISHFLNSSCLKTMYFSFIHSYISYGNIAWGSNTRSNLKNLHSIQKKASRLISNQPRLAPSQPLMKNLNILNIYQLNLYQTLSFMYKVKNTLTPAIFQDIFKIPHHMYETRAAELNFSTTNPTNRQSSFSILHRGPKLWNTLLNQDSKQAVTLKAFQNVLKIKLFDSYFESLYMYF